MTTVAMAMPTGVGGLQSSALSNGTMLDSTMWGLPSLGAIPDLLDCHRGAIGPSLSSVHAADQLSGNTGQANRTWT